MKSAVMKWTVGGAALAALLVASPAQAQFTDPIGDALETLGFKPKDKDPIIYRERAPLVVPPKTDRLRAPEANAGEKNARWPQDPDVLESRRRKADSLKPMMSDGEIAASQGVVRSEQRGNRYAGVPTTSAPGSIGNGSDNPARMISRDQVRALRDEARGAEKISEGEPERQYLTEPPSGYRRPAGNAPLKATVEPMRPQDGQPELNVLRPRN